jgi:hypothetical protein
MSSGSDDYDSRSGLDVNASSSSQRGAARFEAAKLMFFLLWETNLPQIL